MLATFAQPHVALHAFRSSSSPRCLVREVGWKKRDHVTMVLNMDNNAMPDSKKKSFGGLMHNFEGTFQFDFLW